jgi:hypothetical protein
MLNLGNEQDINIV